MISGPCLVHGYGRRRRFCHCCHFFGPSRGGSGGAYKPGPTWGGARPWRFVCGWTRLRSGFGRSGSGDRGFRAAVAASEGGLATMGASRLHRRRCCGVGIDVESGMSIGMRSYAWIDRRPSQYRRPKWVHSFRRREWTGLRSRWRASLRGDRTRRARSNRRRSMGYTPRSRHWSYSNARSTRLYCSHAPRYGRRVFASFHASRSGSSASRRSWLLWYWPNICNSTFNGTLGRFRWRRSFGFWRCVWTHSRRRTQPKWNGPY